MGFLEQLGQFHAQAGQLVDVEETPVIDLFRSNAPIRDPVGLHFEQLVQARETQRVTRLTTELLQCNRDSAGELVSLATSSTVAPSGRRSIEITTSCLEGSFGSDCGSGSGKTSIA